MSFLLVGFKLCSSRCVGICLSVAARQENDARRMRQSIGRSDEHLSPARYDTSFLPTIAQREGLNLPLKFSLSLL